MELDLSPLWISLKTATIATIITFFFGILTARLMLTFQSKFKGLIDSILIIPLVLPPTVIGFLLLLILGRNGIIGKLLNQFEINIIFTWYATIITGVVVSFPLMYRTSLGAFEQIETNILLVARTLGVSEWVIFWRVLLPLSYRGIIAGAILSYARVLGEFGATLMLAGNIPGQTQTIPVAIFFAVESGDMKLAFIWVSIMLFISFSVIFFLNFLSVYKWSNKQLVKEHIIPKNINHSESGLLVNIGKSLENFALEINWQSSREILGLLGGSGSGKSMILKCIAGIEKPDFGQIILNNKILFDSEQKINLSIAERKIGLMFQNYALFPHLTIEENIMFGMGKLPILEKRKRVNELINKIKVTGLEKRYPHELSGGQQQRVALARALAIEPEILLLDEPFSALDTQLRTQMEEELKGILINYQGIVILVSHNLEEIYRICDKILVIHQGNLLVYDDKKSVFYHPTNYHVAKITGCKNFSSIEVLNDDTIKAVDWDCVLQINQSLTPAPLPLEKDKILYVGIRAHHFIFTELSRKTLEQNVFNCWLVKSSETPHKMTVYLKLNSAPDHVNDYHLQAEIFKENWELLQDFPQPWHICLHGDRLFLVNSE